MQPLRTKAGLQSWTPCTPVLFYFGSGLYLQMCWLCRARPCEFWNASIFGAAGCGSTTLGRALTCELECQHLDVDDVYWLPTIPPYQTKRAAAERIRMLEVATHWTTNWVLSGSIVG